mgnify:CR=1 FL=1
MRDVLIVDDDFMVAEIHRRGDILAHDRLVSKELFGGQGRFG